jgi:hypothetical protein
MPTFDKGPFSALAEDMDISVDEFINKCSSSETEELIDALIEDEYLIKNCRTKSNYDQSVPESMYVQAIDKLKEKWNSLTSEEEQSILKIASRF